MHKKPGIYAIKDLKAEEFGQPIFQATDTHAIRLFKTEINRADDKNYLYLYPEDYELHRLGIYDPDTGIIEAAIVKIVAGNAVKN